MNDTPLSDDFELELPPELTLAEATELGVRFLRDGNFKPGELLLRRVLEADPDYADALHFLGMVLCDLGHSSEGAPMVERSVALAPHVPDWHNNFGIVCVRQDALDKAEAAFTQALEMTDGQMVQATFNMGITTRLKGEPDRAAAFFEKAIALDPTFTESYYSYAGLLAATGDQDGAIRQLEAAQAHDNAEAVRTCEALGVGYRRAQRYDKAAEAYRRWLTIEPDNPVPAYYLQAIEKEGGGPDRAPDAYVAETFDRFARSFDSVLAKLDYKAPHLILDALERALPKADGSLRVLDAGAGTGLCGPLVAKWAAHLTGVDLSSQMLVRARDRECYDTLETAELTGFMAARPGAYDLIISADTLCYFGALDEAMAAAHVALSPGGHLLFSVEHDDEGAADAGHVLQIHGRYAHAERYVRQVLRDAGFDVVEITYAVLRREGPQEVQGMVVTARRALPG